VVIIGPADRMGEQAANALLKTLEEPPGEWVIVLVTNRPDALLPTIRSRCQKLRFSRLNTADSTRVLHGAGVADAHMPLTLKVAQGAPGSVLDWQLQGDELAQDYQQAIAALHPSALKSPIEVFAAAEKWGGDLNRTRRFLGWLQLWLSEALQGEADNDDTLPPMTAGMDTGQWAQSFLPGALADSVYALQETVERLDRNINRQIAIEATLVKISAGLRHDG